MTLRDRMKRDARRVLVRADHFGELITYEFKDGTPARTFLADVDRRDSTPAAPGVPQVANLTAIVFLPRHDVSGVDSVAVGDRILVAMRIGGTPVSARVSRILSQDDGGFSVEVVD